MTSAGADYKDEMGYTALKLELGAAMPTGAGISVSQVEAPESTGSPGPYLPDTSNSEFSGKSFTTKSGFASVSGHATSVALNFYGNATSIAPGISAIDNYEANDWVGSGYLRTGTALAPKTELRRIENHSWIGDAGSSNVDILRRLDLAINRDKFIAVVGMNNGSGTAVPGLLDASFNGITVGLSNGNHSQGGTTLDNPGGSTTPRIKPDIVAPASLGFTSFATPVVSASAALLLQEAGSNPNASRSESIKAVLLAGATKMNPAIAQHLDPVFGAGELNIFNSYHILAQSEQNASNVSTVAPIGWDLNNTSSSSLLYFFDVPTGSPSLSSILTWNRHVTQSGSLLTPSLSNLDLKLFSATGFSLGTQVDSSASTVDNVEAIYEPNLPAGRYAFQVVLTSGADTDFAFAFMIPEPSELVLMLGSATMFGALRWRRAPRWHTFG
jgi:hypothetical protein